MLLQLTTHKQNQQFLDMKETRQQISNARSPMYYFWICYKQQAEQNATAIPMISLLFSLDLKSQIFNQHASHGYFSFILLVLFS